MAHALPDFEDQFGNESFSDVEVVICEEKTDLGKKRQRDQSIPGHSMVLMGFSSYCKAKLKNWSARDEKVSPPNIRSKKPGHTSSSYHTMELIVPAGQTEVAVRLVKGMYQKQPDLSDLSQDQQLQLLLLADRFGVPKVQVAAANALKSLSVDELQWDTAIALLQLPASCAQQEDCKQLCEPAVRKLLQQLGDLEQVWADEQLQQLLTGLPHAALLRLLQHDETMVASEATVVFTIEQWWCEQPDAAGEDTLRQLMQQVRMQHLSLEYISSNLMRSDWVVPDCYTASELGIACLLATATSCSAVKGAAPAELTRYPAWTAAKRPTSAVPQEITWALPLSDLRKLLDEHLQTQEEAVTGSKVQVRQGRSVYLRLEITTAPTPGTTEGNSARPVILGMYLGVQGLPPGSAYVASFLLQVSVNASGAVETASDKIRNIKNKGAVAGDDWGNPKLVSLGCINNASEGEAALKEQNLVHADGCLHMAAKNIKFL